MNFPEALKIIQENVRELPIAGEDISQVLGRYLGTDVVSNHDNPPFSFSKWDGFALNSEDTISVEKDGIIRLRIKSGDAIYAGSLNTVEFEKGTCVPIMTGGRIPGGADAVVKLEDVKIVNNYIEFERRMFPGDGIVFRGTFWKAGDTVIKKGSIVTPYYLHLLAELGYGYIHVYKKPVIAFLSVGDELVKPGEPLSEARRFAGGQYFLMGIAEHSGCKIMDLGICKDEVSIIEERIKKALDADMIVTTGGTGKGTKDLMRSVWKKMNAQFLFSSLNIKPGSSSFCGILNNKLWLSLPGGSLGGAIIFCEVLSVLMKVWFSTKNDIFAAIPAVLQGNINNYSQNYRGIWGTLFIKDSIAFLPSAGRTKFTNDLNGYILVSPNAGRIGTGEVVRCRMVTFS